MKYTEGYYKVIKTCERLRLKYNLSYMGTELILYSILLTPNIEAFDYLNEFGATNENFFPPLKRLLIQRNVSGFTPYAIAVQKHAEDISKSLKLSTISTEHLLLAILSCEKCRAMSVLRSLGIDIASLYAKVLQSVKSQIKSLELENKVDINKKPTQNVNQQVVIKQEAIKPQQVEYQKQAPKVAKTIKEDEDKSNPLEFLGCSLVERAKNGDIDLVLGRDEEILRIIQTLSRKTKNNPLLIGDAGVGKTAVVEGLALKIASNEVPEFLKGKDVFSLDLSSLIQGTKFRGEFEERFKAALDYILQQKNIILFIDEIHNIVGAGSTSDSKFDAVEMLKPMLARGEISVIGATTNDEYTKYIERDAALERRFQPIVIEEPSIDTAIEILMGLKPIYEEHHKIKISDKAIEMAVKLSDRYIIDRKLPDKAIDLIDEACSKKHIENSTKLNVDKIKNKINDLSKERDRLLKIGDISGAKAADLKIEDLVKQLNVENSKSNVLEVTEADIKTLISVWTKIQITDITDEDSQKLLSLEDELLKRVVGQQRAIECVSRAVRRSRTNVNDPNKPIGTFLFVGPTGVGKTELAKALSECVFGDKKSLIRFDMSEYQDKTAINKLIGSAPGYVGYEQEGMLTEKVRKNPYSVVLFDEIEKASPEIYDILLQVMGEGRLSDNKGRLISFKNTIIILTSNLGFSKKQTSSFGFGGDESELQVEDNLKSYFKAEFLNRLDEIVVFNSLTKNDCYDIADIMVNDLIKRVNAQGYMLFIENSAMEIVVEESFSETYGARNIKRVICRLIEDLLSDAIISKDVKIGDKITVFGENGNVTYKKG